MRIRLILFFSLLFFVLSCDEEVLYSLSLEIPDSRWDYNHLLTYEVDVQDTSVHYDLVLDMVHSTAYPYQNLYVNIQTTYPDGQSRQQQVSIDMAASSGQWYGKCNKSRCKLRIVLQENAFFNQQGQHRFQIEQYMRESPIKGIRSIAFTVLPTGSLES